MKSCSANQTQHPWPHRSRGDDGDKTALRWTKDGREMWSLKITTETKSGKGDERMRPDMGHHHQTGCRPTAVALVDALCAKWHEED